MKLLPGLILLVAAVATASASPTEDALRAQIEVLRGQVPQLSVVTAAPDLPKQVQLLSDDLVKLAQDDPSRAAEVGPVLAQASALKAALGESGTARRANFYKNIAPRVQALAEAASATLASAPPPRAVTRAAPASARAAAAADANGLTGFAAAQARIRNLLSRTGTGNFDGVSPSAAASPSAPAADAPLPRPRALSRQASPEYSPQVAGDQRALNAARRSEGLRPIAADGQFGPRTQSAVRNFQKRSGLPRTGVIDRATETALLSKFQDLDGLPVTGALDAATARALASGSGRAAERGPGAAFGSLSTSARKVINGVKATVYTPYLARTRKQKKLEGSALDAHGQRICTLERYLGGICSYVSVAIDPRLRVPNMTPLRIPAIDGIAGRPVQFRITDVGSERLFHGTNHIDIATDSDERSGYGARISGREFTIVLPEGLHPARTSAQP